MLSFVFVFFFKRKAAYEMRISDWSSDVCSSDLATKWLAIVFFAITLFMAWHVTRTSQPGLVQQDLGLMSEVPAAPPPATGDAAVPSATSPAVPSAPAQ